MQSTGQTATRLVAVVDAGLRDDVGHGGSSEGAGQVPVWAGEGWTFVQAQHRAGPMSRFLVVRCAFPNPALDAAAPPLWGIATTNAAPPPGASATRIDPWCALAIRRAIASPSPVHPARSHRTPGKRVNGSKTRTFRLGDPGALIEHDHLHVVTGTADIHRDDVPSRAASGRTHCRAGSARAGRGGSRSPLTTAAPRLVGDTTRWTPRSTARASAWRTVASTIEAISSRWGSDDHAGRIVGGKLEQVADQPAEAVGLGDDVGDEGSSFVGDQALPVDHVGVGPDQGRRRPQFVRGVGDEPPLGVERPADRDERPPVTIRVTIAAPTSPMTATSTMAETMLWACRSCRTRTNPPWTYPTSWPSSF